jgi:serralysin
MANFYGTDIDDATNGTNFVNLYGGDGRDFLTGTAGPNEIYGGQGNDALLGADFLTVLGTATLADPFRGFTFGPTGNDYLEGGAGDDIAYGADGNDTIYGGDGNESGIITSFSNQVGIGGLFGGDGDDFIDGGNGNDLLEGENGNDALSGGAGNDTANGGAGSDFLDGGAGADFLNGGLDNDFIRGGLDADTLNGNEGNDVLDGNEGNDSIDGGAGRDALYGGGNRDVLSGGLGRDLYYGGAGADLFDFNAVNETGRSSSSRDQIYDFQRGQDDIDLRTIDANTLRSGNNAFKFIGTDAFSDTAGELRIRDSGHHIIVQGDVNGDGRSDFEILVRNVDILSKGDFLL